MNDRPMTATAATPLAINAAFDGGNIRLVRVDGDRIDLEIVRTATPTISSGSTSAWRGRRAGR